MNARLAVVLRRVARVLLQANTGPVDGLIYGYALSWAIFLTLTPDASFARAGFHTVLAYKGVWVWPALLSALLTPAGWATPWRRMQRLARFVAFVWWGFLAMATAVLATAIVVFWLPALLCAAGSLWLWVREGADDATERSAR